MINIDPMTRTKYDSYSNTRATYGANCGICRAISRSPVQDTKLFGLFEMAINVGNVRECFGLRIVTNPSPIVRQLTSLCQHALVKKCN